MLKKTQIKVIAIVVGTIVAFLLMRFLPQIYITMKLITSLPQVLGNLLFQSFRSCIIYLGLIFSLAIITSLALIFGKIVGGAVGGLASLLVILFPPQLVAHHLSLFHQFCSKFGYFIFINYNNKLSSSYIFGCIFFIFLFVLYGVVIGKVFETKSIKPDSKNIVGSLLPFSLLSAGLFIFSIIIPFVIRFVISRITTNRILYFELKRVLSTIIKETIITGLLIGVLVFVFLLIYLKCVKRNIPLFEYIPPVIKNQTRNKKILRIIGRVALLLVVMGFFMPVGCDKTGFQLAEYAFNIGKMGDAMNTATMIGFFYYVLFIVSLLGGILLIPLIMNKKIPIGFDWTSIIISVICGFYLSTKMKDQFSAFGKLTGKTLQIGGYFIIIGLIVSLLAIIIYSLIRDNETEHIPLKT